MRLLIGAILALSFAILTVQADDGYGERLCSKFMGASAPCSCVGPILEEEYDEEELEPLLTVMKAFMDGLRGNEAAAQRIIDRVTAEHGQAAIEDGMKRYTPLEPTMESACKWKW